MVVAIGDLMQNRTHGMLMTAQMLKDRKWTF